jgi:predicted GIY-YIG superfamily endonuclease
MGRKYCVYILTNIRNTVLYAGATNNLKRRVLEHKTGSCVGFTNRDDASGLIYFEADDDTNQAILHYRQSKGLSFNIRKSSSKHLIIGGRIGATKSGPVWHRDHGYE